MASAITIAEFRAQTVMPAGDVDRLELQAPGFLAAHIEAVTERSLTRLRKRYRLSAPYPKPLKDWVTRIVTAGAYRRLGINTEDNAFADIVAEAQAAVDEIKEAADGKDGLLELAQGDTESTAVSKGGPIGYGEASPYDWIDVQRGAVP